MPPPVVMPRPTGYTRSIAGSPPAFSYRNIARFLAGSTWAPMPVPVPANAVVAQPPSLRFVVANQRAGRPLDARFRTVLLRRIERRDGATLVEVDGDVFELTRCGSPRRPLACLSLRNDISLDEPEPEILVGGQGYGGTGFAQPPP